VFWAGHATLCSSQEDLERYDDAAFRAWFSAEEPPRLGGQPALRLTPSASLSPGSSADEGEAQLVRALASSKEVLRHRDIAALSLAERRSLATLFAGLQVVHRAGAALGEARHVVARSTPGEPCVSSCGGLGSRDPLSHRRRRTRARRIVFLVDVSGSMEPYADSLLRPRPPDDPGRAGPRRGVHHRHPADPGDDGAAAS
jgi:uncharacterized protein with von Willebrand factor type A (vWA) domain